MQTNTQEFYRPPPSSNSELPGDRISTRSPPTQSPPPQYAIPSIPGSSPINHPLSNLTELENSGRQSIAPPVSSVGTGTYSSLHLAHSSPIPATYSHPTAASELSTAQQNQQRLSANSQTRNSRILSSRNDRAIIRISQISLKPGRKRCLTLNNNKPTPLTRRTNLSPGRKRCQMRATSPTSQTRFLWEHKRCPIHHSNP